MALKFPRFGVEKGVASVFAGHADFMIHENGSAPRHQFVLGAPQKDEIAWLAGHARILPVSSSDVKLALTG